MQDEAKADSQSAEFASAVEDAQAWLPQCPESVELEVVTLVPVATSVFSYDGNDSRLLQVSSDGSGSSLTYGAAGFVNSVASWGSADDSAVSFSLLCASLMVVCLLLVVRLLVYLSLAYPQPMLALMLVLMLR